MAGFVVRSGSEEASRGSFLPRFLGFLLLFLVLAHSASAGVFGSGRNDNGNAQEPYLFGRTSDVTQDRGVLLTSDNKNKFKHHNDPAYNKHDNGKHGSASKDVVVNDPDEKNPIHTYNDLVSLYDDKNLNTLNSYPKPQKYYQRIPIRLIIILIVLTLILLLACLRGCCWVCMGTDTVVERRQVVFMVLRNPDAEDSPEAQDQQAHLHNHPES